MRELHIDFETRSTVDLLKCGSFKYFESADTDVLCACFAVDDEPVLSWRRGDPEAPLWRRAVEEGWTIFGHNVGFEWGAIDHILVPRYGWSRPKPEQYRCTAAMAAAMALPRALGNAAEALDMEIKKDGEGKKIMLKMCKPRRVEADGKIIWWEDPSDFDRLVEYCAVDVEVERLLTKRLRPLSEFEQRLWLVDRAINTRGVRVDVKNIRHAQVVVEKATNALNKELARLTDYRVEKVTQAGNLADWLTENGVNLPVIEATEKRKARAQAQAEASLAQTHEPSDDEIKDLMAKLLPAPRRAVDKAAIRSALVEVTDPKARRVLEIRQEAAKSSTAKLKSFLLRVSKDGRCRENLMYWAASTGRWAGRGVQLQNVPRPSIEYTEIERVIDLLEHEDPRLIDLFLSPLEAVSSCLRSFIVPDEGNEFATADFSNIEGRVLAWLAGEEWKLEAFRAADNKTGPDLYLVAASGIYDVPVESLNKKSPERQIGKVAELALGFAGGVGAFQSMAAIYDVKVNDEEAEEIKRAWRQRHPATTKLWKDIENAAIAAVENPDTVIWVGKPETAKLGFLCRRGVLWMQLPSGRRLAYIQPHLRRKKMAWKDRDGKDVWKDVLCCMGVDSLTKEWRVQYLWNGLLTENAVQAIARDIMAEAIMRMEARGWPVVLTVHDEIICEILKGLLTCEEFVAEMTINPKWCPEMPIVAEGDITPRYRK